MLIKAVNFGIGRICESILTLEIFAGCLQKIRYSNPKNSLTAFDFFKEQMRTMKHLFEDVLKAMLPEDAEGNKPAIKSQT